MTPVAPGLYVGSRALSRQVRARPVGPILVGREISPGVAVGRLADEAPPKLSPAEAERLLGIPLRLMR